MSPADEFHAAQQTVTLSEFWMDKYPVTNKQYQQYIQKGTVPQPLVWPGGTDQPVRGVTWDLASAYCASFQKRLPSEAEWEAAGRGSASNPQLFPWGNDPTDGGKALQMPDQDTYDVGSLSFNVSSSGVYDLVGEVWQWVDQAYAATQEGYRVLRGGRFGLPEDLAYRLVVAPDDSRYVKFTGFRCAADQIQ
jgi:formylglycine-generating enzyme required for sulfatase activity